MKNLFFATLFLLSAAISPLKGEIIEIEEISKITEFLDKDALVLFNIAEVLMDTDRSLGTQAWRQYIRSRVSKELHDELTLYVFKTVPPKAVEQSTPAIIHDLQQNGSAALAFTSRGRNEWYSTAIQDIDLLTEEQLRNIDIDFAKTTLPSALSCMDELFTDYYHAGIIYTTNTVDKGPLLEDILDKTGYVPSSIVFIDDKAKSLESVEKQMVKRGIPFTGFAYKRTAVDHANFDIMIAHIQLDWLITHGVLLTDFEAQMIKIESFVGADPEVYFKQILEKWDQKRDVLLQKL